MSISGQDSEAVPYSGDLRALIPPPEEIIRDYPARWTWDQVKRMVSSGDLLPLKRHPDLRTRYRVWYDIVCARHGSVANFIIGVRLGWGDDGSSESTDDIPTSRKFFTADCGPELWTVFPNDWRYAVPGDVEHLLVWTRRPIIDPSRLPLQYHAGGIWGVTGCAGQDLPQNEDAPLQQMVTAAAEEMNAFVKKQWPEDVWETAWFVNPMIKQSIPGIAHIHIFIKRKSSPPAGSMSAM
ncbi:hypothetical protein BKA62DRAFT_770723 [Auriculariales sp. MPI-PUGE-AT-0066]|nr:hypothetical protein BKA62DRAFT_770723 [Auriculariales sp. MPI-PUGE-AT-0066]